LLVLAATTSARAECPTNTISLLPSWGSDGVVRTTSAPRDAASKNLTGSFCPDHCSIIYGASGDAAYDLVAGTMNANAYAYGVAKGEASVSGHDVFTVLGPPSAPPITFLAQAHVFLAAGCGYGPTGRGDASIREGTSNSATASTQSCFPYYTADIGVSITRAAGSTFDLYLTVYALGGPGSVFGGGGDGHASLSLGFPDLPAGYSVVSCQGFGAGQVVATRRSSWGAIKTLYR
jgi:hypothetical protein